MTVWPARIYLINKRLFRAPGFAALLALAALCALILAQAGSGDKGVLTIALSSEDTDLSSEGDSSSGAAAVARRLTSKPGIIRFLITAAPEEAESLVSHGRADGAWILREHYEENVRAASEGRSAELAKVVAGEDSVFMQLSREKLFAAIYPDLSRNLFRQFLRKKSAAASSATDGELDPYYSLRVSDRPLILFEFPDPSSAGNPPEDGILSSNYLVLPLRGMLAVLLFAAGIAAAVFYLEDKRKGCFVWLSASGEEAMCGIYIASALLWVGAASYAALCVAGAAVSVSHELFLMSGYLAGTFFLCDLLRRIAGRGTHLAVLLPLLVVLMLVLCPVFLNFHGFPAISSLLPAFHYLHAVTSAGHVRSLWETAFLYAAADLIVMVCLPLIRRKAAGSAVFS